MAKPSSRGPGERAHIDAAAVVRAAAAVYARAGVAGVTMRSVAALLGVAPNALYSHVRSKVDLLDALVDWLLQEVEIPDMATEWRGALMQLMRSSRRVLVRHAQLMPQFLSRPSRGVNARLLGETTLQLLARGGVVGDAAVTALRILLVYTIGFAAQEAPRSQDPAAGSRVTTTAQTWGQDAEHPRMRALAEPLAEHPGDDVFESGLRWLIDGIAAGRPTAT